MSLHAHLLEGTVHVDGLSIPYYDSEIGDDNPPVVLLHGTGGPAENNFWAVFPMLAFTRRVITFDFVVPEGELSLDHYVRQAAAVIEEVSPGKPVALVGYSLGAVVAGALAGRRPDLVASLVLAAGWMKTDRQQLLRNGIWQTLHAEKSSAITDFSLFTNYSSNHLVTRSQRDYDEIVERSERIHYSPKIMQMNRRIDITADIARIEAPTLVIGCTLDQMVPIRHSRELFGAIHDARYAEIHSGHAVVHERPAELFSRIDVFVTDPRATSTGTVLTNDHA